MEVDPIAGLLEDLVETLEDGRKGFEQAADKLNNEGHGEYASAMQESSAQRQEFSRELRQLASEKGFSIDERGSAAGALHRGWMSLKDALTGDDPHAILAAAETGEDHAVNEYKDALGREDLPSDVRSAVERQASKIKESHDKVRGLRDQTA